MILKFPLDRLVALIILPFVCVALAVLYIVVVPLHGRPFLYRSERVSGPGRNFVLLKIRTMHPPSVLDGCRILGGDQSDRVTRIGAFLRKTRLDELPQIFNILRGDMRFIGPRPPLRRYVDTYPELYRRVLATPPGVTGLATVIICSREERLLSVSRSPEETDAIYRRACIPWKAKLDMLYAERRSFGLDLLVLWRTVVRRPSRPDKTLRRLTERLVPRRGSRRRPDPVPA